MIDIIKIHSPSWILLCVIATRISREGNPILGLKPGEAFIGDYEKYGMTEREYRTAKENLKKWEIATFHATNKGTTCYLLNNDIFDLNQTDETTTHPTDKRRPIRQTNDDKQERTRNTRKKQELQEISSNEETTQALSLSEEEETKRKNNEQTSMIQKLLRQAVGVDKFKDKNEWTLSQNCCKLIKNIGKDEFSHRLKIILEDPFKAKNSNKLHYLLGELESFIHSPVIEVVSRKRKVYGE